MYNQLSLENNNKEPQLCKGFEVLARGIRVCNDGCLQKALASITSCICRECWTWRLVECEGVRWWLNSFTVSLHWSRLSASTACCFGSQQNVLALSLWIFNLEAFHQSPFSMVQVPIWIYEMWCSVTHAFSRFLYHPLACSWLPLWVSKRTCENFPQCLWPGWH